MNEAGTPLPPSIESWRGEFMEAAERHASRPHLPVLRSVPSLRRLPALVVALVAIAGAGVATAAIVEQIDSPPLPPYAGETHAYLNLETGRPIRCPDGSLLTYTPPPGTSVYKDPTCSDGSVPDVYTRQQRALRDYSHRTGFKTPAETGPRFSYEFAYKLPDGD